MSEVWRGSTSAEMWAEIEALRRSNAAHVDTIMAAVARAEAAEAKLDEQIEAAIALRHDLDTLRDLYGAAEARIAAALEEHTPFGPVGMACPTCRSAVKYDGLGRCPTRAALTVEEPTDG